MSNQDMRRRAITTSLLPRLLLYSLLTAPLGAAPSEGNRGAPDDQSSEWPELAAPPAGNFARTAFREISSGELTQSGLARWLESLPGKSSRLRSEKISEVSVAGFDGLARLRAPWPADAVLQFAPFDHDGMGIHFWCGTSGVSLYYYEHPRPMWAGYRTTRKENDPVPKTHVLLGTDNDRFHRTMRGTVEVRHQEGALVLSRGDLRLITVPMADAPTEVIFERRASFRTFGMYRGPTIPEEPAPDGPELFESSVPTRLRWGGDTSAGAKLTRDPAGPVRLERPEAAGTVWSGVAVPATGLYEARIELGRADPGTGIYLADESGQPKVVFGLMRHSPTGAAVFGFMRPDSPQLDCEGDPRGQRVPISGEGQWLRIVAGPGTIRLDVSGDGRHWGRALEPTRGISGAFSQIGLIAFKNPARGQISLNRIEIRQLSEIRTAADGELLARVPPEIRKSPSRFEEWSGQILETQPAGTSLRSWRIACAVAQLSEGSPGALGNTILEGLLDDCLESGMTADRFLRVLNQVALVYDGWNARECFRLTQLYEAAGLKGARRGDPAPWSLVGRALQSNLLATSAQFQTMPESLVRVELVHLISNNRWKETRDLAQSLNFWNRPGRPGQGWPEHRQRLQGFVEWARNVAAVELGEAEQSPPGRDGLCPVVVSSSRSVLNLMSELKTALEGAQYDDACRLLLGARADQIPDLLPATSDPNLYLNLSLVVSTGMNDFPEWRSVMRERYEKLARARTRNARDAAQVEELRSLAAQLSGTPAAVEARFWLGDRGLIEGNFLGALDEFEEALLAADPEQREALNGRIALARACLGVAPAVRQEAYGPPSPNIPPEIEKALISLKSRSQAAANSLSTEPFSSKVFESKAWTAEPGGEIRLDPGKPPPEELAHLDWAGRQLAYVQVGDLLCASNRRQVVGFNLKTGRQLWRVGLPDPDAALTASPMLAFQPVATATRLYVRSAEKDSLWLNCYETATGKLRWRTERGLLVLSDPLLLQGNLYCFTVSPTPQDRVWQLALTTLDPESGAKIGRTPVLEIQRTEGRFVSCNVVLAGNRLIASVAGAILCCDLTGNPVWLRRTPWPLATVNPGAPQENYGAPIVTGDNVLVMQAGALELLCIEYRTGRVVWRRPLAEARRLIGIDEHRAFVQTADGLSAISLASGAIDWWRPLTGLLDANWLRKGHPLLLVQREELPNQLARPLLTWIDPASGRDLALWPLAEMPVQNPQLSHFIPREDGFFVFFGEGVPASRRTLWKLTPRDAPAFAPHQDAEAIDRWTATTTDPLSRYLAARFAPEWSFVGGAADPGNGFREDYSGQREVLATSATVDRPVRYTGELPASDNRSPASARPRLVVQAGHEPQEKWKLKVYAGGRELFSTVVEAASTKKNWGSWEVDLSEFAASGARVTIEQIPFDRPVRGYWKRIELVR